MRSNLIFLNKYRYINIIGKSKNLFINYSNFEGKVIKSFSSGCYFKGSLKRSFYAMESLLLESNFGFKYKENKFIINIISSFKDFKIKKNLKNFLIEHEKLQILKLNYIRVRAHNGVRGRKKRRT
jgi:ribosomal protein S11